MLLNLLDDLATSRYAVDEDGVVWMQFERAVDEVAHWGRGCLVASVVDVEPDLLTTDRHAFLRPAWAAFYLPLTLDEYLERFAPSIERSAA